jgi:hypothetical protein
MTFAIILALKYTIGIRVSEDEEKQGLDPGQHGGLMAYREFKENEMFEIEEVSQVPYNVKINLTS